MADAAATLTEPVAPDALDAEDAKIVTLARSARARTGAAHGAAVRDLDGRTYAACTVALPSLSLTGAAGRGRRRRRRRGAGARGRRGGRRADLANGFDDPGLAAVADVTAGATVLVAGPDASAVHRVEGSP